MGRQTTHFKGNLDVAGTVTVGSVISTTGGTLRAPSSSSAPASPVVGDAYYNSNTNKYMVYQISGWTTVDGTAAGSLGAAYNGGATVDVNAEDVIWDLTDSSNDYKILIRNSSAGTIANGFVVDTSATSANCVLTNAIAVTTSGTGSTIIDGLDVSDNGITNAVNVGANKIVGTTAVIDFDHFDVSASGSTTIATEVATDAALTVTGIQTSASMVTFDNTAGIIASDRAVLFLDAGGAIASGGNILRIAPTGTPNAGAIGIEFVGASKALTAMYIDADPTSSDVVTINGGGALTDNNAVLVVSSDGNLASGGNTFRVETRATPASGAVYAEFDFTGITDTNENIGLKIDAGGKKVIGLYVDGDPRSNSLGYFHTDGAIAKDKAVLEINSEASASDADSAVLRIEQGATDGVANVISLKQDDVDKAFICFESTVGTGNAIEASGAKTLTATHYIMVDVEGVGTRYLPVGTIA